MQAQEILGARLLLAIWREYCNKASHNLSQGEGLAFNL